MEMVARALEGPPCFGFLKAYSGRLCEDTQMERTAKFQSRHKAYCRGDRARERSKEAPLREEIEGSKRERERETERDGNREGELAR